MPELTMGTIRTILYELLLLAPAPHDYAGGAEAEVVMARYSASKPAEPNLGAQVQSKT